MPDLHVREPGAFSRYLDLNAIEPIQAAYMAGNRYDPDMRSLGTRLLADTSFGGAEPYLKLYRQLLKDQDASVRTTAIRALGRHSRLEDIDALIAMLKDENEWVRQEAILAIQRFRSPKTIQPLKKAIRDSNMDVRMAACQALAQYQSIETFRALIEALDDEEYNVTMAAIMALCVMSRHDPGDQRDEASYWLDWLDKNKANFGIPAEVTETKSPANVEKKGLAQSSDQQEIADIPDAPIRYQWSEFPKLPQFGRRLAGVFFDANLPKDRRLNRAIWTYYDPVTAEKSAEFPTPYSMIALSEDSQAKRFFTMTSNLILYAASKVYVTYLYLDDDRRATLGDREELETTVNEELIK